VNHSRPSKSESREAGLPESRETARAEHDPLLATLDAAEWDDEHYTEAERAAAEKGWEAYLRGEVASWEDARRALLNEVAAEISTS
jgi:hypothetical protein